MPDNHHLPRIQLLLIAVIQGLLLLALYKSFELDVWPSQSPLWSYPLWTLSIALPWFLLLALNQTQQRLTIYRTAGIGAMLALVAIYNGWQAMPYGEFPLSGFTTIFVFSIGIACFKSLMYLQLLAKGNKQQISRYQVLFRYSWRNFLVLGLSWLFVLCFWLILMLWAGLFSMINISFFADLFKLDWFLFPALAFAHGLGIIIFRGLSDVLDTITELLQALLKLLLPLLLLIACTFLISLPFTGLAPLWATQYGTSLLLGLTAAILFFVNAVYQDGRSQAPYPSPVHRLIYFGMFSLPFLCGLSLYGLTLRLNQYGWTIERSWAMLIWLLLSLFSAGYLIGIVRKQAQWPIALAQVNTIMGLVVLATLLVANSPLLDFRKLSLNSQLNRVSSGEIKLEDLDFYYIDRNLARPGFLAMQRMKDEFGDDNPTLWALIDKPLPTAFAMRGTSLDLQGKQVSYRPTLFELPADLKNLIAADYHITPGEQIIIIKIALEKDQADGYAILHSQDPGYTRGSYFYKQDGSWRTVYMQADNIQLMDAEALKNGEIELVKPRFDDLKVGGILFRTN